MKIKIPGQVIYFVSVLSLGELATQQRNIIKRFILEHFNAFPSTRVVFGFLRHCKELPNLVLKEKLGVVVFNSWYFVLK
jgi:hypothetical protein